MSTHAVVEVVNCNRRCLLYEVLLVKSFIGIFKGKHLHVLHAFSVTPSYPHLSVDNRVRNWLASISNEKEASNNFRVPCRFTLNPKFRQLHQ